MNWQLIESDQALQQVLTQNADSDVVAVDTEFMRRNTFYPKVALVQLCFPAAGDPAKGWLIDPLAIRDPAPLARLLSDPDVIKVMHSASEDLEVFRHWLELLPQPLFDTQRAAALVGRGFGMGYRALVQAVCDVDLPKGETRSDWLQRPLTASQCEYAAQDVTWLVPAWRALDEECRSQGKLEWVLSDGCDAIGALGSDVTNYHTRIKNAWKLDPRQLGVLAAVCDWRERTARSRDKPRNWIIDDRTCLQLAQRDPHDREALKAAVEMHPAALRRYAEPLLQRLDEQRRQPQANLPKALPGPLDAGQRHQLKRLKTGARAIAQELAVAPEVLLSGKDFELLLREASGEAVDTPQPWSGWRADKVIEPLRQLLRGAAP